MSEFTLNAGFEQIDPPELIASSLFLLQHDGWDIKDYTDETLKADRQGPGGVPVNLDVQIKRNEVSITCRSSFEEEANQHIAESFAIQLNRFVTTPGFDERVLELKHHYYMDNPLTNDVEVIQEEESSPFRTIFSFRKRFVVTPALVAINFLVFILMVISGVGLFMPETADVMAWGANFRSYVLAGDWWRLITCCFIHIGLIHILFNMWALYNIGAFLERMIGSGRFAFGYLISGLAGSLNSIIWHYATPSAGASGAIFGMFGLFLALLTTNILEKGFRDAMLRSLVPMILFNLAIGTSAMIDNAGHIGGLTGGLICGYLFAWSYKNPRSRTIRILSFLIPTVLILTTAALVKLKLPDPYKHYETLSRHVDRLEKEALALSKARPDSVTLADIRSNWDSAIYYAEEIYKLDTEKEIKYRSGQLVFYLKKRKQESELLQQPEKAEELKRTGQSIDSILTLINKPEN